MLIYILSPIYYISQRATFISILVVLYWLEFNYVYLSCIILVKVPYLGLFYLNCIIKYTHLCLSQLYYTSKMYMCTSQYVIKNTQSVHIYSHYKKCIILAMGYR